MKKQRAYTSRVGGRYIEPGANFWQFVKIKGLALVGWGVALGFGLVLSWGLVICSKTWKALFLRGFNGF